MRLASVRIENFRCYARPIQLDLSDLTALIGQNDAGKSTILDALDIFFGNSKVQQDDGSVDGDPSRLQITCEFDELPKSIIIDETNKTTLADEYLLNTSGRLEWTVIYNASLKSPKLVEEYLTAIHPSADGFSDLLFLKNRDLKSRLDELGTPSDLIDKRVNAQLRSAIWATSDDLCLTTQQLQISQIDGGSGKEISDKLRLQRPLYHVFRVDRPSTDQDSEAQDPLKQAVQIAMDAQSAALEQIADHVQSELTEVANRTLDKLRDIDGRLADELRPVLERPRWHSAFKIGLEDQAGIALNKRGSGVRRLVLLSFLQAQAELTQTVHGREAIYAIEEPETSLHPDLQRQLYDTMKTLSERSLTQVLLTTHTPTLGSLLPTTSIRFLEVDSSGARKLHSDGQETLAMAANALGVHRIATVRLLVGVEGPNDMEFLRRISRILKHAGEDIPSIEELEASNRIIMFPFGGANLKHWVHRLKPLQVHELHITDCDNKPPDDPKYKKHVDDINSGERSEAYITSKRELENYIHQDAILEAFQVNVRVDDWNDVPKEVAAKLPWNPTTAKEHLNRECVDKMTPERLTDRDSSADIRTWLKRIDELVSA